MSPKNIQIVPDPNETHMRAHNISTTAPGRKFRDLQVCQNNVGPKRGPKWVEIGCEIKACLCKYRNAGFWARLADRLFFADTGMNTCCNPQRIHSSTLFQLEALEVRLQAQLSTIDTWQCRCRDNLSSPIAPTWGNRALLAQKGPHRGPSWAPKIKGKVNPYDFGPNLGEIEF